MLKVDFYDFVEDKLLKFGPQVVKMRPKDSMVKFN